MNYFKRLRDAAISVALLVIPFFFLSANLKNPSRANPVDQWVLRLSAPLQYVAAQAAHAVSGVLEEYVYLVDVNRDNDDLRMENERLRQETRQLRGQADENRRLRELLGLRERLASETVSAQVIGKDISPYFRVVRVSVDRGARDLVRPGMPVVAAEGLVGQVRRTFGHYSDVMLTVDRSSAVDVVIRRTGARGMLRGTGEARRYVTQIQYLERADDVRIGDEVYTSGMGQRFPAGILVGRITKVTRRDFGLYQQAEVTPSVQFGRLEEVLILTSPVRAVPTEEPSGGRTE